MKCWGAGHGVHRWLSVQGEAPPGPQESDSPGSAAHHCGFGQITPAHGNSVSPSVKWAEQEHGLHGVTLRVKC